MKFCKYVRYLDHKKHITMLEIALTETEKIDMRIKILAKGKSIDRVMKCTELDLKVDKKFKTIDCIE